MSISAAIYGGGPFYSGGNPEIGSIIADLKQSGFTTVIELVHLGPDATIQLAPQVLVQNGVYIGDPAWPGWLADLKTAPTSVRRLLFCLGGWGVGDFTWIKNLVETEGTGPGSSLYQNFQALKQAIPALNGIDLDDETTYDQPSTVAFCKMLQGLGYEVTFCPYEKQEHWLDCLSALNAPDGPGAVFNFNLQCYDGGGNNQPQQWIDAIKSRMGPAFPAAAFVYPGLWCRHGDGCSQGSWPSDIFNMFQAWKPSGTQGGFIWLYDDIQKCEGSGASGRDVPTSSKAYAAAIVEGLTAAETATGEPAPETTY